MMMMHMNATGKIPTRAIAGGVARSLATVSFSAFFPNGC
ncbi:hypothetical protein FBY39_2406 [Microbacterium sp. SLBN-146]|nr:hypothetical protein FBY39_2406 [Microbacterium sp. SLBN-146]